MVNVITVVPRMIHAAMMMTGPWLMLPIRPGTEVGGVVAIAMLSIRPGSEDGRFVVIAGKVSHRYEETQDHQERKSSGANSHSTIRSTTQGDGGK